MSDFDRLAADLEAHASQVGPRTADAVLDIADRMATDMRSGAPTPEIAASVRVDERDGKTRVGPRHPLSHLFEFGTAPRTQESTGRFTGSMAPQPFVWPAIDRHIGDLDDAVADVATPW